MRTIYKFPLTSGFTSLTDVRVLKPVRIAHDPTGQPCAWLEVDTEAEPNGCAGTVVGTGEPLPKDAGEYAGSFHEGPFVWHVYLRIFDL